MATSGLVLRHMRPSRALSRHQVGIERTRVLQSRDESDRSSIIEIMRGGIMKGEEGGKDAYIELLCSVTVHIARVGYEC